MTDLEIIAEAAQGYLGDPPAKTLHLVNCAAAAGATTVKFQLVYADEICTSDHQHHSLFRALEMPDEGWRAVADRCRERGIRLAFDVFGSRSLALAAHLGADTLKLHSTDVLNARLLREVAASPVRRIVLAIGGTQADEIARAVELLGDKDIVLMHGFQGYPTRAEDNQLARLAWARRRYPDCALGFADHVPERDPNRLWLSAVAVGAGVTVLEKHITTALVLQEEDHESALNPDEFRQYVANARLAYAAMGAASEDADFGMSAAEQEYRRTMKKQVVAASNLTAGTKLTSAHLAMKRTSVKDDVFRDLAQVEGRTLARDVPCDRAIRTGDLA
jgi:N,N'-diacetyllegionaminate synthase